MKVTGIRKLAKRGGVIGFVAAGLYVLVRTRAGLIGLIAAAGIGAALWFRAPKPVFISHLDPQKAPLYDLVDLGTQGLGVAVTSLNNRGDAAGVVLLDEDTVHAAVWIDGRMKDIGTLKGAISFASDINDRGEVVGLSEAGQESFFGFRWRSGKMSPLPSVNRKWSAASAINHQGTIAGVSTSDSAPLVACAWEGAKTYPLVMPRGFGVSFAEDVNDRGNLVGFAIDDSGERAGAVHWDGRRAVALRSLGGKSSVAVSLNESGLIGGASNTSGGSEKEWNAVLWHGGRTRDLGRLPGAQWGVVNSINHRGEIVGASGSGCGTGRACIWVDGKTRDLNQSVNARGWHLLSAAAVNDKGQISGTAVYNDQLHGFLLNPRNQSAKIPEPEASDWDANRWRMRPHNRYVCMMATGTPKLQFGTSAGTQFQFGDMHQDYVLRTHSRTNDQ